MDASIRYVYYWYCCLITCFNICFFLEFSKRLSPIKIFGSAEDVKQLIDDIDYNNEPMNVLLNSSIKCSKFRATFIDPPTEVKPKIQLMPFPPIPRTPQSSNSVSSTVMKPMTVVNPFATSMFKFRDPSKSSLHSVSATVTSSSHLEPSASFVSVSERQVSSTQEVDRSLKRSGNVKREHEEKKKPKVVMKEAELGK